MKIAVIDLEKLVSELQAWGLEAEIEYDNNEEAYVVHAGPKLQYGKNIGLREVTIAPGFKHDSQNGTKTLAFVNQVQVHMTNDCPMNSASRARMIVASRMARFIMDETEHIVVAGLLV